jgi:energy-coupling factor transporter ATP-binding protein EcfA2
MLKSLRAGNFKSWRDTGEVCFAPLTAFFGANGSGKSSLLQILLLMKQTADSSDRMQVLNAGDRHAPANLGTFFDLLHRGALEAALSIDLAWYRYPVRQPGSCRFQCSIRSENGRPVLDQARYIQRFRRAQPR